MLGMQQFFGEISGSVAAFGRFIVSFFRDTIQFVKLLAKIPGILASIFDWMPPEIWAPLAVLFSVVIVYKILGREG